MTLPLGARTTEAPLSTVDLRTYLTDRQADGRLRAGSTAVPEQQAQPSRLAPNLVRNSCEPSGSAEYPATAPEALVPYHAPVGRASRSRTATGTVARGCSTRAPALTSLGASVAQVQPPDTRRSRGFTRRKAAAGAGTRRGPQRCRSRAEGGHKRRGGFRVHAATRKQGSPDGDATDPVFATSATVADERGATVARSARDIQAVGGCASTVVGRSAKLAGSVSSRPNSGLVCRRLLGPTPALARA
jgi:hypothetical protein